MHQAFTPPTNAQRSHRIHDALIAHTAAQVVEGTPVETLHTLSEADKAQDLLSDLMHWCEAHEVDFDDLLNLSDLAYRRELEGPGPLPLPDPLIHHI
jgi:hypothetical protein